MLRTIGRALAAATLAVGLLLPAVPAAAAPVDGGGWIVALLDLVADWLPTFGRATAHDDGETLPNLDPDGLRAGGVVGSPGSATGEDEEAYPNLDPDGLTGNPARPQSQTTSGSEDTLPNLDPNG